MINNAKLDQQGLHRKKKNTSSNVEEYTCYEDFNLKEPFDTRKKILIKKKRWKGKEKKLFICDRKK